MDCVGLVHEWAAGMASVASHGCLYTGRWRRAGSSPFISVDNVKAHQDMGPAARPAEDDDERWAALLNHHADTYAAGTTWFWRGI